MPYDPDRHHRRSIRLRGYDYSRAGAYFVTICVYQRECWLGEIVAGQMCLSVLGRLVHEQWHAIREQFTDLLLDSFVVMPNHVHGIIVLCRGGVTPPLQKRTLGQIIAYYKYQTTKAVNLLLGTPGNRVWQRGFYDRIIRNDRELQAMRRYIHSNADHWAQDPENPHEALGA